MSDVLHILVSLAPVVLLLVLLVFLDSFRLTPPRTLLLSLAAGVGVASLCLLLNRSLVAGGVGVETLRWYVAPVVEEAGKAAFLTLLIRRGRVGFIVDAAIHGFAIGAGFALVENLYYFVRLPDASLGLFAIRGFGTAVMHGSTVALFGILSKGLSDRHESQAIHWFLPGLALAIAIHMLFNRLLLPPVYSTGLLLATLPPLVILVFERSERATRHWLGTGFDTDVELLETIHQGAIEDTRVGRYLGSLQSTFPGPVVADMLCLLEIHLELSVRAKGLLLARQSGLKVTIGEGVVARLEELKFLEHSVGRAGRLALDPILNVGSRELWQLYVLARETGRT